MTERPSPLVSMEPPLLFEVKASMRVRRVVDLLALLVWIYGSAFLITDVGQFENGLATALGFSVQGGFESLIVET